MDIEGGSGMNQIEMSLKHALKDAVSKAFGQELQEDNIVIEIPKDKSHGDYSTNVAMQLTRIFRLIYIRKKFFKK